MESLWTQDKHEKASELMQFIVLTPVGLKTLNVTDIQATWALYPNFCFNTLYRIAGEEKDIKTHMESAGFDETQMVEILEDCITSENFDNDKLDEYEEELSKYNEWKEKVIDNHKDSKGVTLSQLLEIVNPHMIQERVLPKMPVFSGKAPSKTTPSKPSPDKGKVGRKSSALQEKVNNLSDDKIINISKITATGTGTVTGNKPNKTSLFVTPNFPFTSNNYKAVITALDVVGGHEEYPEDVEAALAHFEKKETKTTPKSSRTPKTLSEKSLAGDNVHSVSHSNTIVPEAVQPQKSRFNRANLVPTTTTPSSTEPTTTVAPRIPRTLGGIKGIPSKSTDQRSLIPESNSTEKELEIPEDSDM